MTEEDPDKIIETIHKWRQEILARYGGDVAAMNTDIQKRTEASGRRIIGPGELKDYVREQQTNREAAAAT